METLFDPLAAAPPVDAGCGDYSGAFTLLPALVDRDEWERHLLPWLKKSTAPEQLRFIEQRVDQLLTVRQTLLLHRGAFEKILGRAAFSLNWSDREAHSSDSMEYRCLTSEGLAVVHDERQLGELVRLATSLGLPLIPYGDGGGYNMGVVPMAGALTVSLKGISRIGEPRPLQADEERRFGPGRMKLTAGAGAAWLDVLDTAERAGLVLRCRPNTPRASVGGIAGTGSHAGKRIQEVVLEGRAVVHGGACLRFAPSDRELEQMPRTPFMATTKFWGVGPGDLDALKRAAGGGSGVGMPFLPMSLFVGAEGCTGLISELTLLLDRQPARARTAAFNFTSASAAMTFVRAVKSRPAAEQPPFFEIVTSRAIEDLLLNRFPDQLRPGDEAYLVLDLEGETELEVDRQADRLAALAGEGGARVSISPPRRAGKRCPEAEALKAPREKLPTLLRTKCKTDPEIRLDQLETAAALLTGLDRTIPRLSSILFAHLDPPESAILHWNVGGFDIYDEAEAAAAWSLLTEKMIELCAPDDHGKPRAAFSGEHGLAGKAPLLFLGHISENEFQRIAAVKDAIDPSGLFNPMTIFLRSRISRMVHARLLAHSHRLVTGAVPAGSPAAHALEEARNCTRCNACKVCPVIDAEARIRSRAAEKGGRGLTPVFFRRGLLPSKRDLLLTLEKLCFLGVSGGADFSSPDGLPHELAAPLLETDPRLGKCFYCRRCDQACPAEIDLHPLVVAWRGLAGAGERPRNNLVAGLLYDLMLGDHPLRGSLYTTAALLQQAGRPLTALLRSAPLPAWLKTYISLPPFRIRRYSPAARGTKVNAGDNFFVMGPEGVVHAVPALIRFRGCMDSLARGGASLAADRALAGMAGISFADLEADLCCGFPWQAGMDLETEARVSGRTLAELLIAAARLRRRGATLPLTVFSNCPTCQEEIREIARRHDMDQGYREMVEGFVQEKQQWEPVADLLEEAGGAAGAFRVRDAAEPAAEALIGGPARLPDLRGRGRPGLKVPCHNTAEATAAQQALLDSAYGEVATFTGCCGLSGSARLFHPRIGTEVAAELLRAVKRDPVDRLVSGCPSCRDGTEIQRRIETAGGRARGQLPDAAVTDIFSALLLTEK
jgi:FAD/FMN-containing dehydrogenase/Fe-S oxidoreductase